MKLKIAKVFRVVTVPPMLVGLMVVLLYHMTDVFAKPSEAWWVILFLAVIPALAYPLQPILPGFRGKGRAGQRRLAMILSCIGYIAGVVTGYAVNVGVQVQMIFNTYLLSVLILVLLNCFHVHASGHACSVSGPLLFLCVYGHYFVIIPCVVIAAMVVWSSLSLKRHTVKELALGASVSMGSFVIMNVIMNCIF
ncbi:MAG: hypothetical protein E7599_04290 [Ruminococcaceae bacterium]|nr:hypothetical protein [Oscillospiraceae bacterium]